MTRWEKFAHRKNIRTSKKTKLNRAWDENTQTWKRKYGYDKANDFMQDPIYVHKDGDMDRTDPWSKHLKDKKKRIDINKQNQINNLKTALGDRVRGTIDIESAIKRKKWYKSNKFGHLNNALKIAQHTTASMGKFDKLNKHEPKPELKKVGKKRIDYLQTNKKYSIIKSKNQKMLFNKERDTQNEVMFNIFGKQQKNAFNINVATKQAKKRIENKRSKKWKRK